MDPEIREKLQILLQKKAEAVEREDFDEAMQFKEISDKLKMIGSDLSLLETRKVQAVSSEDFETAKAIKAQIEQMKTLVVNLNPHDPFYVDNQ